LKQYQSEEDERRRMDESRNFSPSPQPRFMKPEVVIIRRADLMEPSAKSSGLPKPNV